MVLRFHFRSILGWGVAMYTQNAKNAPKYPESCKGDGGQSVAGAKAAIDARDNRQLQWD